ncbi:MurR/RpiR family transcriptional regulator [Rhizobium sp. SL86]|uniref:MurR/RpiR family transcriptional regulator n=1 Tax=Rhizobium sp. SL86 TaxID=2995148 RepID=UPI00227377E6|nr:MurR/RpiR family transcriptional regulator [Rhizobium sp. SL86]MCY1666664.1 MurR/RpiR family transcriptional regulator [Rhizobium sp. SL86]
MQSELTSRFQQNRTQLSRSELIVAEHLIGMPLEVLIFRSAEEIALETGTSDATVIRTAKRLGFSGLPELKRICGRSLASTLPASKRLEQRLQATGSNIAKVARQMFSEAHEALKSSEELANGQDFDQAISLLEPADTVWCLGFGTAEVIAKHCAIGLSRAGIRTRSCGASGFTLANELIDLRSGDAIVLFHALRDTPELKMIVKKAQTAGIPLVLVSGVQLQAVYADRVSVTLRCVGVHSKLASWNLSAMVIADILCYGVAARNPARAVETKDRLTTLRRDVGYPA